MYAFYHCGIDVYQIALVASHIDIIHLERIAILNDCVCAHNSAFDASTHFSFTL